MSLHAAMPEMPPGSSNPISRYGNVHADELRIAATGHAAGLGQQRAGGAALKRASVQAG